MSLSPTEVVRVHERKYSDLGFSLSQLPVTVTDIFPSPPHLGDFFFYYLPRIILFNGGGRLSNVLQCKSARLEDTRGGDRSPVH